MNVQTDKLCTVLLSVALAACAAGGTRVPGDALVIRNGTVIDGTGRAPIADGVLVIQGDRIVAVGEAADFEIPQSATVLDAGGGSILPGIINSHTHSTDVAAVRRAFLTDGVTTVCNVGTSLAQLPGFDETSAPEARAARGYWAGPIITVPGGYPGTVYGFQFNYEVATPEEARAAVADLVDRGASMIKITLAPGDPRDPWPILDLEQVQAIVEEAHVRGVPVRAHVFEPFLVEDIVLPAGVDAIEHSPFPILSPEEETSVLEHEDPPTQLFDVVAPEFEVLLARVVEQGVVMVPTLDQNIGNLFKKSDRSPIEQIVVDVHVEAVRRFHVLGGTIAVGNDYGAIPGVELGMPLTEMRLLLAAGLTPLEVIEAGTRNAAFVCGQGEALGTLEPGKLADVIIVDGDPTTDLEAVDRVVAVIKGGEIAHSEN
ncbi:MAG: amidohydrolase family protein [Gemmatimonadota bacterium]|nr:MAG: amidohydrolase family protein [Gemmatimonadota bacterium]